MGNDVAIQREHSLLGASSYHRWKHCSLSPKEIEKLPFEEQNIETPESILGTFAHDVVAKALQGKMSVGGADYSKIEEKDRESTKEAIRYAVDLLRTEIASAGTGRKYWIEHRFDLSHIYPTLYGTADFVLYSPRKRELLVADYKHGAGLLVEVYENGEGNPQLLYYALGAYSTLKELEDEVIESIRIMVVQPRCQHPSGESARSFTITPLELMDFGFELENDARRTESEEAEYKEGEWCRFCPAVPTCPHLRETAMYKAQEEFGARQGLSGTLTLPRTPAQLERALHWIPILKNWCKRVDEHAYRLAMRGSKVKGFKLVEKRANRKWADPEVIEEVLLKGGLSVEEIYESKLKSPAQIEKLRGISKDERVALSQYIEKKSSGLVLVPEHDKRPEVASGAEAVFEPVGGSE